MKFHRTYAQEIAAERALAVRFPGRNHSAIADAIETDRKARNKRTSDKFRYHECSDAARAALQALGVTV